MAGNRGLNIRITWEMPAQGETILVIEDDADLLSSIIQLLGLLGYNVLSANDGHSAARMIATSLEIDLVLSDVVLPGGMSGTELYAAVRKTLPVLKYIFMSGYAETRDGELPEGIALLDKPFEQRQLAEQIRLTLDG